MAKLLSNPRSRAVGATLFCLPFAIHLLLNALGIDRSTWPSQIGSTILAVALTIMMLAGLWLFGAPLFRSMLISLAIIVPFAAMELVNRRAYGEDFPFALFTGMWVIPTVSIAILFTLIKDLRTGKTITAHPLSLIVRGVFLVAIGFAWLSLLADQMPCFLGVRYCD